MGQGEILLDSAIRDWVLVPITFAMFLTGIVRHNVSRLIGSGGGDKKIDPKALRESQAVARSAILRKNSSIIPPSGFRSRRHYFINKETGVFQQKSERANPQAAMLSDPTMVVDMMKKNLTMIVPQVATGAWVNFFFAGFITARVPFPLTQRFRSMLQRGVEMQGLDVTYISSLSWYFLNLFGLRGVFSLLLGDNPDTDDARMMQQQQQMMMGGGPGGGGAAFGAEKEALELYQHTWGVAAAEDRAIALLRKMTQ
eukprot:jgi/Chlat1/6772/Chrsp50S06462